MSWPKVRQLNLGDEKIQALIRIKQRWGNIYHTWFESSVEDEDLITSSRSSLALKRSECLA